MQKFTARDALLQLCDQTNWPDHLKGDALTAYNDAMESVHQIVMDFWPELTATEFKEPPTE